MDGLRGEAIWGFGTVLIHYQALPLMARRGVVHHANRLQRQKNSAGMRVQTLPALMLVILRDF
jgi:hypothetical protein